MQLRLAKAKAELDAKGETMTMLAKDVVLYELDKESIENRFNDIIMELQSKVLRT